MTFEKFLHYGYDQRVFLDCLDQIHSLNRRHVRIINSWFLVVTCLYLGFSSLNLFGVNETHTVYYVIFASISTAFEALIFLKRDLARRFSMELVYVMILLLSVYGIVFSVSQPYMVGAMFQVLTVLIALSFIDTMLKIGGALIVASVAFLWASYTFKPMVIFYQDLYDSLVILSLALVFHYSFQRERIRKFVTHKENVEIQHQLEVQSNFDSLTDLLARGAFFKMADSLMENPEEEYLVLCLLDLDGFKDINDTYGHQVGDQAIQETGKVLCRCLGIDHGEKWSYVDRTLQNKSSFAGRLGGDEFICLIRGIGDAEAVHKLAEEIISRINAVDFGDIHGLRASMGLTVITEEDRNIDGAYHRADDALYESKRAGKNRVTFNNKYKRWRET